MSALICVTCGDPKDSPSGAGRRAVCADQHNCKVEPCDDCGTTSGLDRYNDYGGGIAVLCEPCAVLRFG